MGCPRSKPQLSPECTHPLGRTLLPPATFRSSLTCLTDFACRPGACPCWLQLSPECKDLLNRIFVIDAKKRITIEDIERHPW